jgi:hypothetical protein
MEPNYRIGVARFRIHAWGLAMKATAILANIGAAFLVATAVALLLAAL